MVKCDITKIMSCIFMSVSASNCSDEFDCMYDLIHDLVLVMIAYSY